MDMLNKWTRTLVHTEDFKDGQIKVTHYTDGKVKGSYSYDLHSEFFPHPDPIASGRAQTIEDCVLHAKKAYNSFWGPLGARRI